MNGVAVRQSSPLIGDAAVRGKFEVETIFSTGATEEMQTVDNRNLILTFKKSNSFYLL